MTETEFSVHGRRFRLTRDQVIKAMSDQDPEPIQKWAVELQRRVFPVKQVLGTVTGEDRADFISHTARNHLLRLGFRVFDVTRKDLSTVSESTRITAEGTEVALDDVDESVNRVRRSLALSLAVRLFAGRSDVAATDVVESAKVFNKWLAGDDE
jgi:hypothetical protein